MSADQAVHFFLYQGGFIRVPSPLLVSKAGSVLLARHLPLRKGDAVLAQMPTPADREWEDAQSRADNGGPDGWAVLDRIIHEAPAYLKPQGRLVLCGQKG